MPKKSKSKNKKLPNEIIPISCSDKLGYTEKWNEKRNLLNICHPWRGCFTGPPSSGKSTSIKNIISTTLFLKARPEIFNS